MGIAEKHAYRFGYLRSEKWQNFRTEMLVKFKGKCLVCGFESFYLDVHHIWYPKKLNDVCVGDVRVLCRKCHDRVHLLTKPKKYKDRRTARAAFKNFLELARGSRRYGEEFNAFEDLVARRAKGKAKNERNHVRRREKKAGGRRPIDPTNGMTSALWKNDKQKQKVMQLLAMIFHGDNPPICEERRDFLKRYLDWNQLMAL